MILYGGHDELVPAPATRAAWRALPATVTRAYYPGAYHLMLRDHDRAPRITDIIAWLKNSAAPLPSGAQSAATAFLAGKPPRQALPSPPNPG